MTTYSISGIEDGAEYEFLFEIDWATGDATLTAILGFGSLNGLFFDYQTGGDTQLTLDGGVNLTGLKIAWDSGTLLDPPGTPFPYAVASDGTISVPFNLYDPINGFYLQLADGTRAPITDLQTISLSLLDLGFRFTTSTGGSIKDTGDLEETPSIDIDKYVYSIVDNGGDCLDNTGFNPVAPTVDSSLDVITYRVGVENTGDEDLTGVTIADAFLQYAIDVDSVTGGLQINADLDGDGIYGESDEVLTVQGIGDSSFVTIGGLAEGSAPVYIEYAVTAGDVFTDPGFEGPCPEGGDLGDITNIAIADSIETAEVEDDAVVDVTCCEPELQLTPEIEVTKVVAAIADTDDYCENHTSTDPDAPAVDSEGDVITYAVTVRNIGNVTLDSSYIVDAMLEFAIDADGNDGNGVQVAVDTTQPGGSVVSSFGTVVTEIDGPDTFYKVYLPSLDDDGKDPSDATKEYATAVITYSVAATEAEILAGDDIINTVYARGSATIGGEAVLTDLVDDTATVDVDQCPDLELLKTAAVADGTADQVGDIIAYTLTLYNLGNTDLGTIKVTDAMFANAVPNTLEVEGVVTALDSDGNLVISELAFGDSLEITFDYALTQEDINNSVVYDEANQPCNTPVGLINEASAIVVDTAEEITTNNSDTTTTDIVYNPIIDLDKAANKTYVREAGEVIGYTLTIKNLGNVDLTNVVISDTYFTSGKASNIKLNGGNIALTGGTYTIADLDVGQTYTITYNVQVSSVDVSNVYATKVGIDNYFTNTAAATADECTPACDAVTDSDTEVVDLLIGPGVRTPGFWQKWTATWDGNRTNDNTFATKANFPGQDVLTGQRSGSQTSLVIGDFNGNGFIDNGENGFTWNLAAAKTVLNASAKVQQDTRYVLGRDVVASWLNYLAGNNTCRDDLQAGITWLSSRGAANSINNTSTTAFSGAAVAASSSAWGPTSTTDGNAIHKELDYFNNTGICDGVQIAVYGGSVF